MPGQQYRVLEKKMPHSQIRFSKIPKFLLVLAAFVVSPGAGSYNSVAILVCNDGFRKIRTYTTAIKCKRAEGGLRNQPAARRAAVRAVRDAGCKQGAHSNTPKAKVWLKGNRWAYRVTFTCAIIF